MALTFEEWWQAGLKKSVSNKDALYFSREQHDYIKALAKSAWDFKGKNRNVKVVDVNIYKVVGK